MARVEIYTQPGCPYCVHAVDILRDKNVAFTEINAPRGTHERDDAIRRSGGGTTVPQIFIDEKAIGGCTDLMALDRSGLLNEMLGIA